VRVRSKGANSVLAIDIGGTHIKVLTTGQPEEREIPSGSNMTARKMARDVKGITEDWEYAVVSIGYPGPVIHGPFGRAGVFGVTGDLAHKMIFPALYAMVKRGTLKVPVIGVALPKWSPERLHKRVTDSIERAGGVDNRSASNIFCPCSAMWRRLCGPGHVRRAEKGAW
jgi:hypothetical protein